MSMHNLTAAPADFAPGHKGRLFTLLIFLVAAGVFGLSVALSFALAGALPAPDPANFVPYFTT